MRPLALVLLIIYTYLPWRLFEILNKIREIFVYYPFIYLYDVFCKYGDSRKIIVLQ